MWDFIKDFDEALHFPQRECILTKDTDACMHFSTFVVNAPPILQKTNCSSNREADDWLAVLRAYYSERSHSVKIIAENEGRST